MGDSRAGVMIAVVIPCFNEAARLDVATVGAAIDERPDWRFLFVDDGSTDNTDKVLETIRAPRQARVSVIASALNRGKGEAVRCGMLAAIEGSADVVAYMDADVSAPFCELDRLVARLQAEDRLDVVLGSRVRLLGTDVRRAPLRHFVGRIYGTVASLALGVAVYDTQCGAKAFRTTTQLIEALSYPFSERWAFDVELLSRLTRGAGDSAWQRIVEEPLLVWHAQPGSKLGLAQAARAGAALLRIGWRHRRGDPA